MSKLHKALMWVIIAVVVISIGGIVWYKYFSDASEKHKNDVPPLPAIKITLTNGCGYEGLAKEFSKFLEDKNVDIVTTGNSLRPIYDKTIIVVRKGDNEDLKRLQQITGISRYTMALSESAPADFEIIIGKDYEAYTKN